MIRIIGWWGLTLALMSCIVQAAAVAGLISAPRGSLMFVAIGINLGLIGVLCSRVLAELEARLQRLELQALAD